MTAQIRVFRDAWAGSTDGTLPGLVDGIATEVPKASYEPPSDTPYRTAEDVFTTAANLDRLWIESLIPRQAQPPVPLGIAALGTGGFVVLAGPPGPDNPLLSIELPLLGGRSDLLARIPIFPGTGGMEDASHLYDLHLPDADWGALASLELRLDLGIEEYALLLGNIPDLRIRLDAGPAAQGIVAPLRLYLDNVESGEVDARDSFRGVDVHLAQASDGAGQTSFAVLGSAQADRVVLSPGTNAALPLSTDGAGTLVTADLGAGDDVFDAGTSLAATEVAGGPDAGRFYAGTRVVSLGYGDGPVFARLYDPTTPVASTAALLADWLDDAAAAGLDGFRLKATVGAGTRAAQSSVVDSPDDIATAQFFSGDAAGAPRDPFPEPLLGINLFYATQWYNGLGVVQTPGPSITYSRDIRNREIGEYQLWTPETGLVHGHDVLAVRFGAEVIAARIDLSAFFSDERGPGLGEVVRIAVYDHGHRLLRRDFTADEDTGAAAQFPFFAAPINPGTGHVTLDAAALGIASFDEIRIIGFQPDKASTDSNDMLLDGIRLVLKGEGYGVLGGDVLRAGAGPDRFIHAPGDGVDTIERFTPGQDQLVLQGIAPDRVTLEESAAGTAVRFLDAPAELVWLPGVTGLSATAGAGDTLIG
ncbi:hypothetical protein [Falsiroseomonas sp. HW251]|uniref:hypothetical protein n=1 Tax=Falsiroseomonas sp. HW251 TaxID=3390998 RepID=UPI003D31094F